MEKEKNIYIQLMTELVQIYDTINIVQIGANDGQINDPIYDFVMKNKEFTNIALIEPQSSIIEYLEKNYESHPSSNIYNFAIGPEDSLKLFRVKPEYYDVFIQRYLQGSPNYRVPSGFTSSIKSHVVKHITGNIPDNVTVEEVIEEIIIPCLTLTKFKKLNNWNEKIIHVLQIDTEGMDDQIIYSSDLKLNSPLIINFEHFHLKKENEERLNLHLKQNGYHVHKYSNSDTLATKFNLNQN
jgi:hypothetical protein